MGIFDRLGRVARSEVTEMKRVLREARASAGDPWDDRASYEADVMAADAELARELGSDPVSEAFARELGAPGWDDAELARGASVWGAGPATPSSTPTPTPTVDRKPVAPGWVDIPNPWGRAEAKTPDAGAESNPWGRAPSTDATAPRTERAPSAEATAPRPGRTETFPREVREAYAVLELPLGADRSRIDQAFRALLQRYHPDLHAGRPELQQTATELTVRLQSARELLFAWLEGRR